MNTKTKEGARNKGKPYFLRVPWNKGGLVNTGPGHDILLVGFTLEKCMSNKGVINTFKFGYPRFPIGWFHIANL